MVIRKIIHRVFWSLVTLATFIALFYAEEDWRGARAWQQAQVAAQQAGESLDYAAFVPPSVPDSDNLATLPLFSQQLDSKWQMLRPFALDKALRKEEGMPQEPSTGFWQHGESPRVPELRDYASACYRVVFKAAPPLSALAQLEAVYPFLLELRRAAGVRTHCRFDVDYVHRLILGRSLALLTDQIQVTHLFAIDGLLALDEHQPGMAIGDLQAILLLQSGVLRDPSLVATLVGIGMGSISESIVSQGLAMHVWNDAELAQLQEKLADIDFLSACRFAYEGELAGQIRDMPTLRRQIGYHMVYQDVGEDTEKHQRLYFPFPWPNGWIDESYAHLVRFILEAQAVVDPGEHRVSVSREKALGDFRDRLVWKGRYVLPWNFLFMELSMGASNLAPKIARSQAWLDHSTIACGLERYRMAQGAYPSSISDLVPRFLHSIPHDVIRGDPYRYRVLADGGYLLYSVGWNEVDDGGKLVFLKNPTPGSSIDYDQGDWVWFGPK